MSYTRSLTFLCLALLVLLVTEGSLPPTAAAQGGSAYTLFLPTLQTTPSDVAGAAAAPGLQQFIIVLKPDVGNPGAVAAELTQRHQGRLDFVYQHALKGFSANLPLAAIAGIQNDPRVAFVEADQDVHLFAQEKPTGIRRSFADTNANLDIDGIDDIRIDVDVAVLDTGIDFEHPDLNVNKAQSVNCTGGSPLIGKCTTGQGDDDHYHGTHVAGTIGALDNGIGVVGMAPGARLWSIKVLNSNGSGYTSWIIAGIDYVTKNADKIEVANMSLGCECYSAAQDQAIANSVAAGVTFVVAAGNSDKDAATFSPANHPDVITVSALADFDGVPNAQGAPTCRADQDDTLADFSNWGSHIEIAAPGVCILSTYPIEQGSYGTISGTSMASPHGAGAAALLAASLNPITNKDYTPSEIRSTLIATGNDGWTDDSGVDNLGDGKKEPLLDVSNTTTFAPATVAGSDSGGGGTNSAPTASFTYSCTGLTCSFDGSGSSDSDGTISSYAWDFGDSLSGTGVTASHTYAAGGTYNVTLTVADDDGATGTMSKDVTVSASSGGGITLSATGYKVKGTQMADLSWSGATNVDIYRSDVVDAVATDVSGSTYTDNIGKKGGGSYTYQVCEAGTSTCSNEATVTY